MVIDAEPEHLPYNVLFEGLPIDPINPSPPVDAVGIDVGAVAE